MIIVTRVDYVTPLCSQVTYEGLLDEVFGIQSGCIEFGHEVSGRDQPVKLMLTSQDEIFEEIRNRHFTNVFSFLSGKAKEVQSGYDKRHQLESVRDMKDFVANDLKDLKQQHKSLALFIGASEVIMSRKTKGIDFEELLRVEYNMLEGVSRTESINYIEERLNRQFNCLQTLRLLCLLSLTQDGIPPKEYKSLKTQFLHAEGYDWMLTFHNLKKLGLLKEQADQHSYKSIGGSKGGKGAKMAVPSFGSLTWKSSFQTASKSLKLIPKDTENLDLRFPTDMSYVFGGAYTPLSCKLVEQILNKCSFEDVDPVLKTLSIPRFSMMPASARFKADPNKYLRVVLVYFLGGCTYSEITALRFLGKVKGYKFIIATTSIITGARLLDQVTEVTPK
ncbi:vacuolar protein sorting-associated protein 33B-like [Lingula anatina]|uniref:Vacuolar protein sorting-associated protein 33B-like n=1 Tax=Lingula anatina TaxID=7574 RepID=A0A1S3HX67_LINAN|nr:vacuolar protein sorting-associated protein 33B-like [Lingula anatina]|eukprot:XP_013390151.2 vacuolar protein sorting-associated protein 33B-like [Lingula anatina]